MSSTSRRGRVRWLGIVALSMVAAGAQGTQASPPAQGGPRYVYFQGVHAWVDRRGGGVGDVYGCHVYSEVVPVLNPPGERRLLLRFGVGGQRRRGRTLGGDERRAATRPLRGPLDSEGAALAS